MKKIIFIFGIALMTIACSNKTATEMNDSITSDTIISDTICTE